LAFKSVTYNSAFAAPLKKTPFAGNIPEAKRGKMAILAQNETAAVRVASWE
jgi:hypothetical protein